MKIKIVKEIPVEEKIRPKINEVYEVIDKRLPKGGKGDNRILYYVIINNEKVGVFINECEVVENEESKI